MDEPKLLEQAKRLYISCSPTLKFEVMKAAAASRMTIGKWIIQAITEKLERDSH